MKGVLPVIIVCAIGLAACFSLLVCILVQYLKRRVFIRKKVEYDLDERTLTIKLSKKDFKK